MDEMSEDYDEDSYDQGYKSNDWVRWYDAAYAKYYYFNEKTYEVQWEKPEDFNELDVSKVTKSPLSARAVSDAEVARSLRENMDLEAKGKENASRIDHKAAEAKQKKNPLNLPYRRKRNDRRLIRCELIRVNPIMTRKRVQTSQKKVTGRKDW